MIETNNSRIQIRALLFEFQGVISTLADAETGQRGYLLVGEDSYLAPYKAALQASDQHITQIDKLLVVMPNLQPNFTAIKQLIAAKLRWIERH